MITKPTKNLTNHSQFRKLPLQFAFLVQKLHFLPPVNLVNFLKCQGSRYKFHPCVYLIPSYRQQQSVREGRGSLLLAPSLVSKVPANNLDNLMELSYAYCILQRKIICKNAIRHLLEIFSSFRMYDIKNMVILYYYQKPTMSKTRVD